MIGHPQVGDLDGHTHGVLYFVNALKAIGGHHYRKIFLEIWKPLPPAYIQHSYEMIQAY